MAASEEVVIWTRLAGVAKFLSDATAEAKAVRKIGDESERAAHKGFLFNQALFTARRFLYAGTIALTVMTGALVKMGFQLNITMEEATIAFTRFLGSEEAARRELEYLYGFAARTPFRFEEVIAATRRFMAFGFTLQETNKFMQVIADTASGLGGNTADNISRLVLVLGQMKSAGRVLGNDLLQLAALGIDARKILVEGLAERGINLTPRQIANFGELQMPSSLAIDIIMQKLDKQFGGMAAMQAKTFRGRWSTMLDYMQQFFAQMTRPLFESLRDDVFPEVIKFSRAMTRAWREGGFWGAMRELDSMIGARGSFVAGIKFVIFWFRTLKMTIMAIIPALRTFLITIGPIVTLVATLAIGIGAVLRVLDELGLTTAAAHLAAIAFGLWLTKIILVNTWLIAVTITSRTFWLTTLRLGKLSIIITMFTRLTAAMRAYAFATAGATAAERARFGAAFLHRGFFASMIRWMFRTVSVIRVVYIPAILAATRAMMLFLLTNPVGWAILIITTLVILYFKWKAFRDLVNAFFEWTKTHWPLLLGILLMPFLGFAYGMFKIFQVVRRHITDLLNWIVSSMHWLRKQFTEGIVGGILSGLKWAIPGYGLYRGARALGGAVGIPGMAEGGTVSASGMAMIGERGPELMYMPRGATVSPLGTSGLVIESELVAPVILNLDGRKLAESNARWRLRVSSGNAV